MHRKYAKYVYEFENEVAVAGGIDAVGSRSIEAEFLSHGAAIKGQGCSRHRTRTQRTQVQTLAAVSQPSPIAQKHFDVSQQPVPDQHGFGTLQVSVGRHC